MAAGLRRARPDRPSAYKIRVGWCTPLAIFASLLLITLDLPLSHLRYGVKRIVNGFGVRE